MRALTLAHGLRMPPPRHTTRWRLAAAPPPQPVPVKALVLSVLGHVVIVAALVGLALLGVWDRPTVHVVNLVSTIAAVGNPAGSPASLPARTLKPTLRAITPEPEVKVERARQEAALAPRRHLHDEVVASRRQRLVG